MPPSDLNKAEQRRRDTRQKIELGGLVVKAGLREEDRAFILGLLADGSAKRADGEFRARMIALGREEFSR